MQLRFHRCVLQLTHTWRVASGSAEGTDDYPVVFVELTDASGVRGLGEAASTQRYGQPVNVIEDFLRRVDPMRLAFADIPGSMDYLDSIAPGHGAAKCGLNLALLDGAGRAAGQSVGQQLQLPFEERRHVTSFSIGLDTPDAIRAKVRDASSYPILKLKIGGREDRAALAALREAAPTTIVRVDANEAWKTPEEALRNLEWLHADGRVEFVEQPLPSNTPVEDWVWLKQRSPLPIFADESYHHAADAPRVAACYHGVNVKLVKSGGISGAKAALEAARRYGLRTMIGCMIESSLLITAAAHLAALADHLDLDGNLLIKNDPYLGVTAANGLLSFARTPEPYGLRVSARG